MDKFSHLLLLSGLLSVLFLALSSTTNPLLISTTPGPTGNTTASNFSNSSSSNLSQNTTGNTTPPSVTLENATVPELHNTTNSTSDATQSNSIAPSPTTQTEITSVQITSSATATSLATRPGSEPTTVSVSSASTTVSVSATTEHGYNESTSNVTPTNFTDTTLDNRTQNITAGGGLKHSEKSMTILFSVVLGVIVLIVLGQFVYRVSRNKHRSVQYSHRPLQNDDAGEQFLVPDDTLVISGGLYDGPQIYNPTVSVLNDEDQPPFAYRPTQFRLEFLGEDQGADLNYEAPTYETFKTNQEP